AAGATFEQNVYVLYFWLPPRSASGTVKPVKIWKNNSHWQWVFPLGTVLGEVLFIQAPDDKQWFTFEVRSRTRALNGWVTGVFRPYLSADELAAEILLRRPGETASPDVRALVEHLQAPDNLTPNTMSAQSYAKIFPPINGAMDYLPATSDLGLIKELLT